MFLGKYLNESDKNVDMDDVIDDMAAADADPDSPEAMDTAAKEVEALCRESALENASFFENGERAVRNFTESAEVQALVEARKMSKNTFIRLNKNDDLTRRSHLACLVLAKKNNDPLWKKLALNRVKERQLREAIYKKYGNRGNIVAKKSQQVHIKQMRKMPSLPKIKM